MISNSCVIDQSCNICIYPKRSFVRIPHQRCLEPEPTRKNLEVISLQATHQADLPFLPPSDSSCAIGASTHVHVKCCFQSKRAYPAGIERTEIRQKCARNDQTTHLRDKINHPPHDAHTNNIHPRIYAVHVMLNTHACIEWSLRTPIDTLRVVTLERKVVVYIYNFAFRELALPIVAPATITLLALNTNTQTWRHHTKRTQRY